MNLDSGVTELVKFGRVLRVAIGSCIRESAEVIRVLDF
jgi:hypothetical protein